MATEEQHIAAGEFVLGTLSGTERADFARAMQSDPELRDAVAFWQTRLAPLNDTVPGEAPPRSVWAALEAAIADMSAARQRDDPADNSGSAGQPSNVVQLRRSVRFWRGATLATGALAAALAFAAYFGTAPIQPAPDESGRFVAVVDADGREPAMIVSVDTGAGTVSVRTLTATVPADKSLELWYIDDNTAARSLGVVDEENAARVLSEAIPELTPGNRSGLIAITLEPKGGSPTGAATGPIVYTGKLIREE